MTASKSGPTTYGQLSVLRSLEVHGPGHQAVANLIDVWEVPPGTRTSQVIDAWRQLVEAHESLRTTYDQSGPRPLQIVQPMQFREIATLVVDDDSFAAVHRIGVERAVEPISTEGLPWRVFVALYGGEPCSLAVVIHHVAADNTALTILKEQFTRLLHGDALGPVAQPLDMARDQQESSRHAARHLQYWTGSWGRIVSRDRDPGDSSVRRRASIHSAAAMAGAQRLSSQLRVSVQSVVLGAGALAVARMKEYEAITFALMAANRLDPRWASLVSSLNQYAPITIDVDADASPADFLKGVYVASLGAYMHASYDVDALKESLNRAGYAEPDPTAFAKHFNFLGDVQPDPEPDSRLGRAVEWRPSNQRSGPNFHLYTAAGKTGLHIGVGSSTDYLDGDLPATLALAIEAAIVRMAAGTQATLREVVLDPVRTV